MVTYTHSQISDFFFEIGDLIAIDEMYLHPIDSTFNDLELMDLFSDIFYHPESNIKLFKQYIQHC